MTCPLHVACKKYRNDHGAQKQFLGKWEPIAYLAVWAQMGRNKDSTYDHVFKTEPDLEDMRQWIADNVPVDER